MIDKPDSSHTLGLDLDNHILRGVQISLQKGSPTLDLVFEIDVTPRGPDYVKPLYMTDGTTTLDSLLEKNLVVTSLKSNQVLVRSLEIKVKKEGDLEAVFAFQAEPLLPFPGDAGILDKIKIGRTGDVSQLTVVAARKELVENHLKEMTELRVEPEVVTTDAVALMTFANHFFSSETPYVIVHFEKDQTTCVLINKSKLVAAQCCLTGASAVEEARSEDLRLEIVRTLYALGKQLKGVEIPQIFVTGNTKDVEGILQQISKQLNKTLHRPMAQPVIDLPTEELQKYAIPMGAALGALSGNQDRVNFRQGELNYPHPWRRYKRWIGLYTAACLALAFSFYLFGESYLGYQRDEIKKHYVSLLTSVNKPYATLENEYSAKYPSSHPLEEGEVIGIKELTQDDLLNRLEFLQKELQATPDIFPLYPNVPRVSDVLAWLSNHPKIVGQNGTLGEGNNAIQLESMTYIMLKRPEQTKKQERYQVKVELEFSTATPKTAREFHDALIAPNELVDSKGEVKWSSTKGRYRTSFFLKDRTQYPSQVNR